MKPIIYGVAAMAIAFTSGCETAVDLAVGSQVDGTWAGKFYCGQGLPMNATLNVQVAGKAATGKFTLGIPRGNLDAPGPDRILSSYSLQGAFDPPNLHLSLQPVTWLEGLEPNHQMRPIEATLRTDGKTLELPKSQGCTETLLTKQ